MADQSNLEVFQRLPGLYRSLEPCRFRAKSRPRIDAIAVSRGGALGLLGWLLRYLRGFRFITKQIIRLQTVVLDG